MTSTTMPPTWMRADAACRDRCRRIGDQVAVDDLGAGEDRVGDLLGRRAAIADIVLDAEIAGRAAGIVAGRQDDAAEGLVLADDVEAAGVDRMPPCPTSTRPKPLAAAMLDGDLDDLAVEVAAVAADHQRLARRSLRALSKIDWMKFSHSSAAGTPAPSCAGPTCRASGPRRAWWRRS
jgi:hypothetical protein